MDIRHLKYFIAVAEEMNFRRAAERLNMSQPPLSKRVQEIEQELGVALFLRKGQGAGVTLTQEGRHFLEKARMLLDSLDNAQQEVIRMHNGITGNLKLAFCDDTLFSDLAEYIASFHRQYPNVFVNSSMDLTAKLTERVLSGEIDIAFVVPPLPIDAQALSKLSLSPVRLKLVLPRNHSLAKRKKLHLKSLARETFAICASHPMTTFRIQIDRLFAEAGFKPRIIHEGMVTPMYTRIAAKAGYISIISEFAANSESPDYVCIDIDHPDAAIKLAAVWDKNNSNPVLMNFVELLSSTL